MPRPASPLWTHFRRDGAGGKRAVCKYCAHDMCGLVSRMRAHLARKCPDCPVSVKEEMFVADMSRKLAHAIAAGHAEPAHPGSAPLPSGLPSAPAAAASPRSALSSLSVAPVGVPSVRAGAPAAKKPRRGRLPVVPAASVPGPAPASAAASAAAPALAPTAAPAPAVAAAAAAAAAHDKADEVDSLVAKAVLGTALPVGVVEAPAFARLLKRLGPPGYEPPSAFALATTALDGEFAEAQLKLRAEVLDAPAVCLGVESWAAALRRPVLSCVVHNTPTPGVFALESTGEVPHTPEVLVEKMESVMTQIGTGRVAAVVTDSTSSDAMRQAALALQAKYPAITFLPSCAHAMVAMVAELLALAPVRAALGVCHELARFFARHHAARAALARIAEQMPELESAGSGSPAAAVLLSPLGALDGDAAALSMDAAAAAAAASASPLPACYYTPPYVAQAAPAVSASASGSAAPHPVVALERLMSVHHHRHSLDVLLAENHALSGLSAAARDKLLRLGFWEDVAALAALLEPFLDLLRLFDADYPLLSTFYHRFTLLWSHVDKFATGGSSNSNSNNSSNSSSSSNGAGAGAGVSTAGAAASATPAATSGSGSSSTAGSAPAMPSSAAAEAEPLPGSAAAATGALAARFQRVMSRYWQSIQHPAMYTAYLLDPRFPAASLSPEATSEVLAYLKRAADGAAYGAVVSELTRFTGRAGLFADDAVWASAHKCGPLSWWKGFIGAACPSLQAVALRTLCFPASSGLSRARRDMVDRIQAANARFMNDEQVTKAALVHLNMALAASAAAAATAGDDDGAVANETIV